MRKSLTALSRTSGRRQPRQFAQLDKCPLLLLTQQSIS